MDLTEIKKRIKKAALNELFISDTVGGHGVVFLDHTRGAWLFLETDKDKLSAIKKLRNIF